MEEVFDLSTTRMSASSTDAPVLGDRPYPLTDDDHRGIALTMSILFLVYTIMVLVMRVAGRYRNMGVDDWLSIAATVYSTGLLSGEPQLTVSRLWQYHNL